MNQWLAMAGKVSTIYPKGQVQTLRTAFPSNCRIVPLPLSERNHQASLEFQREIVKEAFRHLQDVSRRKPMKHTHPNYVLLSRICLLNQFFLSKPSRNSQKSLLLFRHFLLNTLAYQRIPYQACQRQRGESIEPSL